jgi:uncharacterized protein (DUF924 family)
MKDGWQDEVLDFWFMTLESAQWFKKDDAVDAAISERFGALHEEIAQTNNDALLASPKTALAAIIVLDQFSRNMFRGSPKAFATDAKARDIADRIVDAGQDDEMTEDERFFVYMPFMHVEDIAGQEKCVELFEKLGKEDGVKYAKLHRDVIAKFGRFPHRNEVLGRETTAEEQAYLDDGGGF